jgi:hypothetical protein
MYYNKQKMDIAQQDTTDILHLGQIMVSAWIHLLLALALTKNHNATWKVHVNQLA